MVAMRNRFMAAAAAMSVFRVVRSAGVARRTSGRVQATLRQRMFIHMSRMKVVKMSVVQIIDVTFMFDCDVSAI